MARIKAFRGLRPVRDLAAKVAAPPYDVLSSDEAREMAAGNSCSFLHVSKPEIDLDPAVDLYDDRVYEKAGENFRRFVDDGILVQDSDECLYVYRQRMGDHVQTGLVAGASVEDYDRDIIKKHELTRADKEDDRTRHMATLNANTGPVFLTYRAMAAVDTLIDRIAAGEPEYHFTSADGIEHTFWVVRDADWIAEVQRHFASMDCLYVADGHHRSASASRVRKMRADTNPHHSGEEEYNFFLSVIFPHDQMLIMDYNRVVKDLNGLDSQQFLSAIGEHFTLEESADGRPTRRHDFGMYLDGKWYRLTSRPGSFDPNDPVHSLDVSILQEKLLAPVLGVGDPRKDKRIDFVGGIRGLKELERLVDQGRYQVAFAFYPTSIGELMAISDAGKIMPPKSTWFEPKLKSGLVVHLLD